MELLLKLDEKDILKIVKEWAEKEGYTNVTNLKMNLGIDDYERGFGKTAAFRNIELKVNK